MNLTIHGGFCCGISSINGLYNNPKMSVGPSYSKKNLEDMGYGTWMTTYFFLSQGDEPTETGEERMKRLIKKATDMRPKGLIEVVLITKAVDEEEDRDDDDWSEHQRRWIPVLESLGFVPVTTFINSNTYNELTVYHLVTGVSKEETTKAAPWS